MYYYFSYLKSKSFFFCFWNQMMWMKWKWVSFSSLLLFLDDEREREKKVHSIIQWLILIFFSFYKFDAKFIPINSLIYAIELITLQGNWIGISFFALSFFLCVRRVKNKDEDENDYILVSKLVRQKKEENELQLIDLY